MSYENVRLENGNGNCNSIFQTIGGKKTKIQLKFKFQCSRKTENENTSWNSIFNVLGKRKTKMESRIPFSGGVGKRKTKVQV